MEARSHDDTLGPMFEDPNTITISTQGFRVPTLSELRAVLTNGNTVQSVHDPETERWACCAFQLNRLCYLMGGPWPYDGDEFMAVPAVEGEKPYLLPLSYGLDGCKHQACPQARHYALLLLHHPLLLEEPKS